MAGNGPLVTVPNFASDETVFLRCRGDFAALTNSSEQMASGTDGVFAADAQWALTSASVDFQAQGVSAQYIIQFTAPKGPFAGSGRFFAVDTAVANTVTLRVPGKAIINGVPVGQPPAPVTGLTGVTFVINSLQNMIDEASYKLKTMFAIDENDFYRSSSYIYAGADDPYRCLRAATVLRVLDLAYTAENRSERGDWMIKLNKIRSDLREEMGQVEVRWGALGNAAPPSTLFGCKLSR